MATGKTLELREIKPKKHYAEKAGQLRMLADGSVYVDTGRGWRYLYRKNLEEQDDGAVDIGLPS